MNTHNYALMVESEVRKLMGNSTQRFALGGVVDADNIEFGGMVVAIIAGLSVHYNSNNAEAIDNFVSSILEYNGLRFREIDEDVLSGMINNFIKLSDAII